MCSGGSSPARSVHMTVPYSPPDWLLSTFISTLEPPLEVTVSPPWGGVRTGCWTDICNLLIVEPLFGFAVAAKTCRSQRAVKHDIPRGEWEMTSGHEVDTARYDSRPLPRSGSHAPDADCSSSSVSLLTASVSFRTSRSRSWSIF